MRPAARSCLPLPAVAGCGSKSSVSKRVFAISAGCGRPRPSPSTTSTDRDAIGYMPTILSSAEAGFAEAFETLLASKREASVEVGDTVAAIIADVRKRGDAALIELTRKFDVLELTLETMRFSQAEIDAAYQAVAPEIRDALVLAHRRITAHHEKQKP